MQDNYGRNINYLRLSITDVCNYRCIYCMDSDGIGNQKQGPLLSIEELINIGRTAVDCGIQKIRLTGGEPLVRKDVLKLCEGLGSIAGLAELALTTNGALLPEMAEDLKAVGVDRLNISLDTLNEAKFKRITRAGKLDEVLKGIEQAVKIGFENTKINVVLMAGINDDEIVDFVNLTRNYPLSVRFIELMPIGPGKTLYDTNYISNDVVLDKVPELVAIKQEGVSSLYKLKDSPGTVGLISPISHCFCESCNRIRVTADGRLLPCLHSDLEYSVRGLTQKELKDTFMLAVKNKPVSHHIIENHVSDNSDYMHKIGG